MKTIEELKQEQYDLKAKLHEIVEFINSEEYFSLSPREKGLISQQRMGMELYLNALTNRIYSKDEYSCDSSFALWLPLISSMFTNNYGFATCSSDNLSKESVNDNKNES